MTDGGKGSIFASVSDKLDHCVAACLSQLMLLLNLATMERDRHLRGW